MNAYARCGNGATAPSMHCLSDGRPTLAGAQVAVSGTARASPGEPPRVLGTVDGLVSVTQIVWGFALSRLADDPPAFAS
jgi:hypothetical protein